MSRDNEGFAPKNWTEPIETPASTRAPRPIDREGLPFLYNDEVAPSLGITSPWNFNHAAYREVPHYTDVKSTTNPQSNRVYFALKDIVNHFEIKAGEVPGQEVPVEKKNADQLAHGSRYRTWKLRHEQALTALKVQKEAGINTGSYTNQPWPGHKDIHTRLHYGVRRKTVEGAEFGNKVGTTNATGSGIDNPIRHGHMAPIEGESDSVDYFDPRRPRR